MNETPSHNFTFILGSEELLAGEVIDELYEVAGTSGSSPTTSSA